MKKKKILMLVCMAVLAVTVVIPVNAAKKNKQKTDSSIKSISGSKDRY